MRATNVQTLPVEERRTIIEAEIKEIEGRASNSRNKKKLQRKKVELKAFDNPEAVNFDVDDTMSEHGRIVSNRSNTSNESKSNASECNVSVSNVSNVSEREFLDDSEVANYNKIQYLKARYLHLQSQSKI